MVIKVVLSCILFFTFSIADIKTSLIAHYEFEGNAYDSSGYQFHGYEDGNVTYVSGAVGYAASFGTIEDSRDYHINVAPNLENRVQSNDLTISYWVKTPEKYNVAIGFPLKFGAGNFMSKYYFDSREINNTKTEFEYTFYDFVTDKDPKVITIDNYSALDDNTWIMLTVSFNSQTNTFKSYINGVLVKSEVFTEFDPLLNIGKYGLNIAQTGIGIMDDLRIYSRALEDSDVIELYELSDFEYSSTLEPVLAKPIKAIFDEIKVPYHKEIKPSTLKLYYEVDKTVDLNDLMILKDNDSIYADFSRSQNDSNIVVAEFLTPDEERFDINFYYDSFNVANTTVTLTSVPFREASEQTKFTGSFSPFAGLQYKAELEVLGVGGSIEAGAKSYLKAESNLVNGLDQLLSANSQENGDLLLGLPSEYHFKHGLEASLGKLNLSFANIASSSLNLAQAQVSETASYYKTIYPRKLNYPDDIDTIALLYIPNIVKSFLPKSDIANTILSKYVNPYKETYTESYKYNFNFNLWSIGAEAATTQKGVDFSFPFISFGASLFELNYLDEITRTVGKENHNDIDLIRQTYKGIQWDFGKITIGPNKITSIDDGVNGYLRYFERGKENGDNVVKLGVKLNKDITYDILGSTTVFDKSETVFKLSEYDFDNLKTDFSLTNFENSKFFSETLVESWLISKDFNVELPLLKASFGVILGIEGEVSVHSNKSEKVLAGVAYKVDDMLYEIYHNTFDNGRFLYKNVDLTQDYPSSLMLTALQNSTDTLISSIEEYLIGNEVETVSVKSESTNQISYNNNLIAEIKNKDSSFDVRVYTNTNKILGRVLYDVVSLDNNTSQAINNANLNFITDFIYIDTNESGVSENILFYPMYGDINNTILVSFENGFWKEVDNSSLENGYISSDINRSGIYAIVKDFTKEQNLFVKDIINIDTNSSISLESETLFMESGDLAIDQEFELIVLNSFAINEENLTYTDKLLSLSNNLFSNSNGKLTLDINTSQYEGEASIRIKSKSGYIEDEIKLYITKNETPKPLDTYEINIKLSNEDLSIGDSLSIDIDTNFDINSSQIIIVDPQGIEHNSTNVDLNLDGSWEVKVTLYDNNGYKYTKNKVITVSGIKISKGWNLLSTNLLTKSLAEPIQIVWKYKNGQWSSFSPNSYFSKVLAESNFKVIDKLENNEGSWVYSNSDIELIGLQNSSDTIKAITNDFELYGTHKDINVSELFCEDGELSYVWKYSNNSWYFYSPKIELEEYQSFNKIYANEGYWAKCEKVLDVEINVFDEYVQINGKENTPISLINEQVLPYSSKIDSDFFTISMWVKLSETNENNNNENILTLEGEKDSNLNSVTRYSVSTYHTDHYIKNGELTEYPNFKTIALTMSYPSPDDRYAASYYIQDRAEVLNTQWQHLVFRYNPNQLTFDYENNKEYEAKITTLFYNGEYNISFLHSMGLEDQGTSIPQIIQNPIFKLGSLDGYVDDIRIYNKSLSDDEIKSIYESSKDRY